jgi:hypothetical protein
MRSLTFKNDDLSKKRFEVLFHGLMVMGNQTAQKGLTVLKNEIALLDKLEAISAPCECGKKLPGSQEDDRELKFEDELPLTLIITDPETDLLYDYISKVPWSIGESSRLALKTLEWVRNPS